MCERDDVLHQGSSLFIELIAGGGAPPQWLLAIAQRSWPAGLGQGAAASWCAHTSGGPASTRPFGCWLQRSLQTSLWLRSDLVRNLAPDFDFPHFIQNIFSFQKLYKNKIWKWENLYYQKIIFIRFSEKLYF